MSMIAINKINFINFKLIKEWDFAIYELLMQIGNVRPFGNGYSAFSIITSNHVWYVENSCFITNP